MRPFAPRVLTAPMAGGARARLALGAALVLVALGGGSCGGSGSNASITRGAPTLHNADGAQYLAHEIVVRIRPGTTEAELGKTLSALGGKVIDASGALGE